MLPQQQINLLFLVPCLMDEHRKKILTISGSTRPDSANEQILQRLRLDHGDRLDQSQFDITALPYFNPGVEPPASVVRFLESIAMADGVLVCTPEYVFSLPGILKNALEWTVATVVFSDKPTAFIVASSSGEKAFESLDLVLTTLGVRMAAGSKLLIRGVKGTLDAQGQWKVESMPGTITRFVDSFVNSMIEQPLSNTE